MTPSLVLARARLPDGRLADIHVADGAVAAVVPAGGPRPEAAEVVECGENLVAPSLVEGHVHLDKTLLGLPFVPHRAGNSVAERIAAEKALRRGLRVPIAERGARLIEQVARFGTGSIRSHVDIDTEVKLSGLHALLDLKHRFRDLVDLQIVAFPQSGILRDPGTADLLDAAMTEGADLVGGLDPAGIDGDVKAHLDAVFGIAAKRGAGIDIHLHDPGPLGAFELRDIAARTIAAGLEGRVAVSHGFALGALDDAEFGRTAEALARARVAIMTNEPGAAPMPPVKRLEAAGVAVFVGSDNIRDAWSPYGDGDLLRRAGLAGYRQGFLTDDDLGRAFAMVTTVPAAVLGLPARGPAPGAAADLAVIPAGSVAEAVAGAANPRTLLKRGRVVVRDGVLLARPLAA